MGSTPVAVHSCVCLQNHSIIIIVKANKSKGFPEKFRKYFRLKNQGFGASPKIKMGVSAAKLNRSFSGVYGHRMCLLLSQISYPQIQRRLPQTGQPPFSLSNNPHFQ